MIDETYVTAAARAMGLELGPDEVPAVLRELTRIEALAQPVLDVLLAPEDEAAPVWRP